MIMRRRCAANSETGQTMVEFAMVATVLLMVIFGITLMSLAIYNYNIISSAARTASRYAMVHSPSSPNPDTGGTQTCQVAIDSAPGLNLTCSDVTLNWVVDPNYPSATCPTTSTPDHCDAQVTVTYSFSVHIPFIGTIPMSVSSTSQILVSQ